MQEYLLVFRNASNADGYMATSQDRAADMPLWQSWIGNIAMQGKLVSTAPIEFDGLQVTGHETVKGPHRSVDSVLISGFLLCRAESMEEVAVWSRSCPILKYPNSSVEIRPIIPFPVS